jgi:hypothetical protein
LVSSPNGRWLALKGSDNRTVRVLDLTQSDPVAGCVVLRSDKKVIERVWAITSTGRWLGVILQDNKDEIVELWDLTAKDPPSKRIVLPGFG